MKTRHSVPGAPGAVSIAANRFSASGEWRALRLASGNGKGGRASRTDCSVLR